ncbi:MAG: glycosyltransferase family 2 protein [Marinovum sp.]|nr:glycosyltransferase family 2 protein [Marinovum sp.]
MSSVDDTPPTYPGGIEAVLAQMEGRLDPLNFAEGEALPPLDADLVEMTQSRVPSAQEDPLRAIRAQSSNHRKFLSLRTELAGRSELAVLHGLLVAHLRKSAQPPHTAALFQRLWAEQSDHLLEELNPRWQVSAITTFGDHGMTTTQRRVGATLSVLFNTMKLYETERRYSGFRADRPFSLDTHGTGPLPLQMDGFSIKSGGLDINMLGRLWKDAEDDEVIQPLAHALLDQLIHDPRTIFRRLRTMRARIERRRVRKETGGDRDASTVRRRNLPPVQSTSAGAAEAVPRHDAPVLNVPVRRSGALMWGAVCTTIAPLDEIKRWAAHYLTLGADRLYIFLDTPNPEVQAFFAPFPKITVIACTSEHWAHFAKGRPETHQRRQAYNATFALRSTKLHFLGHFDTDEFLISANPVSRGLDFVPPEAIYARARPIELLAPLTGAPMHFKRTPQQVGLSTDVLEELYPNFGPYLAGGFISHTSGKIFARSGTPQTELGIHNVRYQNKIVSNWTELPRMSVAHAHARDFDHFCERVAFRLEQGSYIKRTNPEAMALADVLTYLLREEGQAGLRAFYDEVCTAQSTLLKKLDAKGMLVHLDLDLDATVERVFAPDAGAGAA